MKTKGITLVSLIVTIVILLILAGVTISVITNTSLLKKTEESKEETNKSSAIETMNLKITNIQISSYAEGQKLPTLQYVADKLCEDNEMEYVLLESKKEASLEKIKVNEGNSIFTKLKNYSYEFEINNQLQLASINGVKVSYDNNNNNNNNTLTNSDVFKSIDFEIDEEKQGLKININPEYNEGKSKDDAYLYILLVDGKCVNYSENNELIYSEYKANTTYKLDVLAIDKKGNSYKESKEITTSDYVFTNKLLEYPIITANGVCNVKVECKQDDSKSYYIFDRNMGNATNANAMPIAAYDGDSTTYAGQYNTTSKYLSIDSSAVGKKITINSNGSYQSYRLGLYSDYSTFKHYGDTRKTSFSCTLPDNAEQYLFRCYGNESCKFYEITFSD